MALRFLCPNCHRELEVPDEAAGTAGQCRLCGAAIIAPAAPGQPAGLAQPPGAPPPPGGYAPGAPQAPTGALDLGAIVNEAFQLATRHWALMIAAGVIVFVLGSIVQNVPESLLKALRAPQAILVIVSVGMALLMLPLQYGLYYVIDEILLRGNSEIGRLFRGYRQWGNFILTYLLQVLATLPAILLLLPIILSARQNGNVANVAFDSPLHIVLALAASVLGTYIGIGVLFAPLEVVDKNAAPVDAIKASWEAVEGRRLQIVGIMLVLSLIGIAGILALCVGILFTMLIPLFGLVLIYRQLRGLRGEWLREDLAGR